MLNALRQWRYRSLMIDWRIISVRLNISLQSVILSFCIFLILTPDWLNRHPWGKVLLWFDVYATVFGRFFPLFILHSTVSPHSILTRLWDKFFGILGAALVQFSFRPLFSLQKNDSLLATGRKPFGYFRNLDTLDWFALLKLNAYC